MVRVHCDPILSDIVGGQAVGVVRIRRLGDSWADSIWNWNQMVVVVVVGGGGGGGGGDPVVSNR